MDEIMPNASVPNNVASHISTVEYIVEKQITSNDIRARILSIPKIILDKIPRSSSNIDVIINQELRVNLSINRGRNYLAGVTDIYRKYGLLTDEGLFNPQKARWSIETENQIINILIM